MNVGGSLYKKFRVPGVRFRGLAEHRERMQTLRKSMTPSEKILWSLLRNRQFHGLKFRRQHGIGPYIVDFYCDEAKLIIEVDGGIHDDEEVRGNDIEREQHLKAQGYRITRFSNDTLDTVKNAKKALETELPLHSWRG